MTAGTITQAKKIGPFDVLPHPGAEGFYTVNGPGFLPGRYFASFDDAAKAAAWRNSLLFKARSATIKAIAVSIVNWRVAREVVGGSFGRFRDNLREQIRNEEYRRANSK